MKIASRFVLWWAFIFALAGATDDASSSSSVYEEHSVIEEESPIDDLEQHGRRTPLLGGGGLGGILDNIGENLGNTVCNFFLSMASSPLRQTTCTCDTANLPTSFDVVCRWNTPVCNGLNIVCGVPTTLVTWNLITLGSPIGISYCFLDISIFGFALPGRYPLCIGLGNAIDNLLPGGPLTGGIGGGGARNGLDKCAVVLGEEGCRTCEVCEGGVKFDCSNVYPDFVQTECFPFQIPDSFRDLDVFGNVDVPDLTALSN